MAELIFPKGFIWGTGTSSYQIEGAHNLDGKGESIWDRFSHSPGNILNGDTGDMACDHYKLFREDVKLLKEIGVKSYRFSISWPRIFPDGTGKPNEKGMDFYRKLTDLLNENGIIPLATLYHWDLPQKLQETGGWTNPKMPEYFEKYSRYVFRELEKNVPMWTTFNEPWVSSFIGYWYGGHPPGLTDLSSAFTAAHQTLVAHGRAVRAFREMDLKGEIGITLNLNPVYPASDSEEDFAAASRHADFQNGWFLDPLLKGKYPENLVRWLKNKAVLPEIKPGDWELIRTPIDFLGVNNYSSSSIRHQADDWPFEMATAGTGKPRTDTGWEIYPEGLYDLLVYLHQEYSGTKLIVTENGAAFRDELNSEGKIEDEGRVGYLRDHIIQIHRAIRDGVPLAGYYVWSFLDNFEWRMGYSKRFGLVYVDYPTQKRTVKKSGYWYRDVIEKNGF